MAIQLDRIARFTTGIFDDSAAEIPAYDSENQRLFIVNGADNTIDVLDVSDPQSPIQLPSISVAGFGGGVNSVATKFDVTAAAIENNDATQPGVVVLFDIDGIPTAQVEVGVLPDMLTFTPDGSKILVANEGEPDGGVDPQGSISIIDVATQTVSTADFTAFDGQEDALRSQGVRIFPGTSVSEDVEPEYIAVSPDGTKAWVTLQENNAVAIVDIASATVENIVPLGLKDHSQPGNGLDANDNDGINIQELPVFGMFMPDAIASYNVGGQTYYVTANEGDDRGEDERVGNLTNLDTSGFTTDELTQLDRLGVSTIDGDTDGDGQIDRLQAYGTRSFSIWNSSGNLVFDSGDDFEQITATAFPDNFNANNDDNDIDGRSDNKGPEPEGVVVGEVDGRTYAFVGLERIGGVMVYDVTEPANAEFVEYVNNRDFSIDPGTGDAGDLGPEGLAFVSAADSPNGVPLLIVANEVSGSTSIYEIQPQATTSTNVFVNEIHYDNTGTDTGEFIELAGEAGTRLDGWSLVLYNGTASQRSPYNTIDLTGNTFSDQSSGFGFVTLDFPSNGIQNGAPDGLALVDAAGDVVQFLSYEGTFEAASGPAAGLTSTDIGVAESSSTPVGFSLQLTGNGTQASDFTWAAPADDTPGAVNNGQTFGSTGGGGGGGGGGVFTLQLLHAADQEAAIPALDDAPRFSAVLNALADEDRNGDGQADFPNTLRLSSGDAYIPGLFLDAAADPSLAPLLGVEGRGRADIVIQNELGFEAISFGNHEFDLGTAFVASVLAPDGAYPGAAFPYLSANLDFSTDSNLAPLVTTDGQEASTISGQIAGNTIVTVNGEKIGVVGATTPTLPEISSPGDVTVNPLDFDSNPTDAQLDALAAEIQTSVDSLLAANPDLNKVVLLAHMQQIGIEQALSTRLQNVDIIVAGGSNTRLFDSNDRPRPGDTAQGPYPIFNTDAAGDPVAIVNTDGNYRYVGRLVVDFDADGKVIPGSYDPDVSGAYATDDQGVADVNGTPDPEIVAITDALRDVITTQDGNFFGITTEFLNSRRSGGGLDGVRNQETNLGNLTADANLALAQQVDTSGLPIISLKNGGGIRNDIGRIETPPGAVEPERLPPAGNPLSGRPEGGISQIDIVNTLSFNNGLSLVTVTATELQAIIEHGVGSDIDANGDGILQSDELDGSYGGRFPQVSGLSFSFDPSLSAGNRVLSLAIEDEAGNDLDVVIQNGQLVGDPNRAFRLMTLDFLADGGSGYPIPLTDRVDLVQDPTAPSTGVADFAPDGSEQDALAEYLAANFSTTPFSDADTPREEDLRIQNVLFRDDTVIDNPQVDITPIYEIQGAGQTSPFVTVDFSNLPSGSSISGDTVTTQGIVTAVDSSGFYLQDATGDGDIATSDAIFVFTGSSPSVSVGDELEVSGTVSEFFPGGTSNRNLPTTQIGGSPSIETLSTGNTLPAAQIIGQGGRVPPSENIDDDAFGSFDAETDGIDFFESLEAMRVTAQDAVAVAGTNRFGEIFAVADNGADATGISARGTLNISPDDFNPEKIQIDEDSGVFNFDFPSVSVGDFLGDVTGVVGYGFGNFEIIPTEDFTGNIVANGLQPETTDLTGDKDAISIASYNVLNLDPNDGDGDTDVANGRFDAIAQQIVSSLNAPDVLGLQEVQDNSGSVDDGTVAADETLQALVDAIAAAGGPTYQFIDNTFIGNNLSGGQPGGNIRTAFLYNADRVSLVDGSVQTIGGQGAGEAFAGARLPLVATFEFNGEDVTVVNNHFSSKGGSAPILGIEQPFDARQEDVTVNGSLDERQAQSEAVQAYVSGILSANSDANAVVLGDLNEFEFISPVTGLESVGLTNLVNTLDADERYSFIFQGNSQELDHILVSDSLLDTAEFDIVHTNVEFAETSSRASDHDPLVARFDLTPDNGGGSDDKEEEPNGTGEDLEEGTGNNTGEESGESGEATSEDAEDSGEAASEDVEDSGEANPESAENVETSEIAGTTIEGTDEFDVLTGTAGDDEISGGEGSDILAGGEGRDTFVYDSIEDSIDLLTDYQVGEDRLDVSQIFDNAEIAASSIDFWEIAQGTVVLFDDGSETRPLALVLGVTETELDRPENFIV